MKLCDTCSTALRPGKYDAAFTGEPERLFFALPAELCIPCKQLYVRTDLLDVLGLTGARCTYAIETDSVLTA